MIIIAILIGLCAGAVTFFLIDHFSINRNLPTSQFKREQAKALQGLIEKKNAVDKEFDEDLMHRHNERKQQFEQELKIEQEKYNSEIDFLEQQRKLMKEEQYKRLADMGHSYEVRTKDLERNYEAKAKMLEEQATRAAQQRQEAMEKEITEEQKKLSFTLQKLQADYKDKEEELNKNFFQMSEQINLKKAALTKELEAYQQKQEAIIARFKADEEKKSNLDFYRIRLSDAEIEDVKKLKQIANELHNPTILYKLIWENYYKSKFSELVGRVAPAKAGCGIYKITNIGNGRVYIGQTKQSFNDRWRSHVRRGLRAEPGTNNKLYGAMWEDGPENFTFEIVEQCKAEELNEKEKYYIGFYKGNSWGYNSTGGNKNGDNL